MMIIHSLPGIAFKSEVATLENICTNVSKNVVMSMAWNYHLNEFQKYVLPLRKHYNEDIVLVINPKSIGPKLFRFAENHRLKLLDAYRIDLYNESDMQNAMTPYRHMMNNRPTIFSEICDCYNGYCLNTDFRDVFYQDNPFKHITSNTTDLILSVESINMTIIGCRYNHNWVRGCFGIDAIYKFGSNPPINAGTLLGNRIGFRAFSEIFNSLNRNYQTGHHCNDQGVVNYMWYMNLLKNVTAIAQPQGAGIINTIGGIDFQTNSKYRSNDGKILNNDASVSPVVHQYDRFPVAAAYVDKLVAKLL